MWLKCVGWPAVDDWNVAFASKLMWRPPPPPPPPPPQPTHTDTHRITLVYNSWDKIWKLCKDRVSDTVVLSAKIETMGHLAITLVLIGVWDGVGAWVGWSWGRVSFISTAAANGMSYPTPTMFQIKMWVPHMINTDGTKRAASLCIGGLPCAIDHWQTW